MPCPMGVDIPDNFSIWNKLGMFGQKDAIRQQWTARFPDAEKAFTASAAASVRPSAPNICRFVALLQSSRRNWTIYNE